MGLSSQGKDIYAQLFESLLTFKNGRFVSRFGPQKRGFFQAGFAQKNPRDYSLKLQRSYSR